MKTKSQKLAAIADREAREEIIFAKPSLRERVAKLRTYDPEKIRQLFGVKVQPQYWGTEAEKLSAGRKAVLEACRTQATHRRARRKAEEIGLAFWPAILWNDTAQRYADGPNNPQRVDPAAFVAAEQALLARGEKPWGTKVPVEGPERGPKDRISHGGWDSCGHYGVSPQTVAACWFASGCKNSPKFRWLIRHGGCPVAGGVKSLSIRQLRDLKRGQKWLSLHFGWSGESHYFSTKAIIVLGRISPAARKAAVEGLDFSAYQGGEILPEGRYRSPKIRIRDLNWGAVKALQTMTSTEVCSRYLRGRYAWTYLHGVQAPKGLEKVSPVGWSKDGSGVWSARTVTFRDFSIWAPEGYSFGVDANGVKLFEVASPEED